MFSTEIPEIRQKWLVFQSLGGFLFHTHQPEALIMFANLARILTKLKEKKPKTKPKFYIRGFISFTVSTQITFALRFFGFIQSKTKQMVTWRKGDINGDAAQAGWQCRSKGKPFPYSVSGVGANIPLFNAKKVFTLTYIMSRKVFEILLAKIVSCSFFFSFLENPSVDIFHRFRKVLKCQEMNVTFSNQWTLH